MLCSAKVLVLSSMKNEHTVLKGSVPFCNIWTARDHQMLMTIALTLCALDEKIPRKEITAEGKMKTGKFLLLNSSN